VLPLAIISLACAGVTRGTAALAVSIICLTLMVMSPPQGQTKDRRANDTPRRECPEGVTRVPCKTFMSALGHTWTAPWQELSYGAAALVGCGHVSGLFGRPSRRWAIILCANRVQIVSTHSTMRGPKRVLPIPPTSA